MLSESIKKLRQASSLTQVQLAEILGVTKQSVSNWENNNIQPSVEMLIKLARHFRVSTDYLLGLSEEKTLDVSGLTDEEISHVSQIVSDIEK